MWTIAILKFEKCEKARARAHSHASIVTKLNKLHIYTHTHFGYAQLWKFIIILHHSILAHDERVTKKRGKKNTTQADTLTCKNYFQVFYAMLACAHPIRCRRRKLQQNREKDREPNTSCVRQWQWNGAAYRIGIFVWTKDDEWLIKDWLSI